MAGPHSSKYKVRHNSIIVDNFSYYQYCFTSLECLFDCGNSQTYLIGNHNKNFVIVSLLSKAKRFNHLSAEAKRGVVELLETATYLICQDEDVTAEYFLKILTTLNVPTKLFRAADKDGDGDLSISEVMNFLLVLTTPV